ncbi:hypothetical protein [Erythrobacter sp. F6033]|uniref:hypothetical protein n=1 Tax=Erythrobacter sp. F6033 TaxID=2926401 RepID=UPI001FF3CDAD|nr:hypothetical protein [Erythrobacter sp. F6033]MCK0129796.1 hypothetical protein [Erythrobacter sp. F6033]
MTKLFNTAAAALGLAFVAASPAAAQDKAGDKVNMVIAYDENECPEAGENEIVVCEILVEAERYRIPSNLRQSDSPQNTARRGEVETLRYITQSGAMSCSPAGAGGFTGCTQQFIDAAYAEKSEAETIRFGQLIEQARQERLSTIDEDAAAEQGRVEQIEREYLERLERERNQPLPGEEEVPAIGPKAEEPEG